jgi:predicted dehydrogenase
VTRCAPAARTAAEIIAGGRLGRIYHAKACMYRRRGIPGLGGWFTDKSRSGGGALIDIGAHLVDAVLHYTGRPAARRVSGVCAGAIGSPIGGYVFDEMWGGPPNPDGVFDVEDQAAGLLRFADGMTAEVNVTWAVHMAEGHFPDGVVLMGERAGMYIDAWSDNVRVFDESGDEDIPVAVEDAWPEAFQEQARRFLHSIETRTPPDASGQHGRDVQAILDAWYRSAGEGRDVAVG